MKKLSVAGGIIFLSVLGSCLPASADTIQIFNTGVDGSGNLLASGSVDPHYSITSSPVGAQNATVQFLAPGSWVPDTSVSQWIAPAVDAGDVGDFLYQTTFSLAGLDPSTATLTGLETGDNELTILVNGTVVFTNNNPTEWGGFTAFTINSGLIAGTNTLVFDVHNDGGPSGLQIQISGTAQSVVPEPGAWLLFCSGAAILVWLRRRTRIGEVSF